MRGNVLVAQTRWFRVVGIEPGTEVSIREIPLSRTGGMYAGDVKARVLYDI